MSFNRRRLLRMLATTSCVVASQSTRTSLLRAMVQPPPTPVFLFFHGFFFFDVQETSGDQALVVVAPNYQQHHFLHRDQGVNQFDPIPQRTIDLRPSLTGVQKMKPWPKDILNFSKSSAGLDVETVSRTWSSAFGCLLLLPFPVNLTGQRFGGTVQDFSMSGNVASLISAASGPNLSLVTRLEYTSGILKNHHFYAEHCDVPNDDEIGRMLDTARTALGGKFQQKFDLKMTHIPVNPASSSSSNDEASLPELAGAPGNPCAPLPTAQKEAREKMFEGLSEDQARKFRLIRTANCPMFGMTS